MEVNAHHPNAVIRLGLHVLDVVDDGSKAALEVGDDAFLHFLGRQTLVHPQYAHDRNVDIREDIHRHGRDGTPAKDSDKDGHHHKGVRATESEPDDPHNACLGTLHHIINGRSLHFDSHSLAVVASEVA